MIDHMTDSEQQQAVDQFERYRPLLLGLAYRLLGSMWDAEDVVQDAYLRWMHADRAQIRSARAFLTTVVSRLALDQLRSARVTREAYPGPWLPEPADTSTLGPQDTAEQRDTLSYATLAMMERLNPAERAVVVLRNAFDLPYEQIAEIIGTTTGHCRQLHRRALSHLTDDKPLLRPTAERHAELLGRFLTAARDGDLTALTELLSEDVTAWNDGGGKVRAARQPVRGRHNVKAFIAGVLTKYGLGEAQIIEANGGPAIRIAMGNQFHIVAFEIRDRQIHNIFAVMNPDKLKAF